MTNSNNYLAHYGVMGMKWGVRKKKITSPRKQKRISRKEYKNTIKKNKQHLRKYAKISLYSDFYLKKAGLNKKAVALIEEQNRQAIKNIHEARLKRGKKKVDHILYNLPGTFV